MHCQQVALFLVAFQHDELLQLMKERFLAGEDAEYIDYAAIDR